MIARLRCYLVGHDPELLVVDRIGGAEWWDCRRHCGWYVERFVDRRRLGLVPMLVDHGHGQTLVAWSVSLILVAIVALLLGLGVAGPGR